MSTESFADLGVSRAVISSLSRAGITEPFAIQGAVIGDAIAGREVVAKSQAGSGKTLAFAIPLVERIGVTDPRTAARVLAPTAPDAGGGWVMRGFDARGVRRTVWRLARGRRAAHVRRCPRVRPALPPRSSGTMPSRPCGNSRSVGDWQDDLRVTSAAATRSSSDSTKSRLSPRGKANGDRLAIESRAPNPVRRREFRARYQRAPAVTLRALSRWPKVSRNMRNGRSGSESAEFMRGRRQSDRRVLAIAPLPRPDGVRSCGERSWDP
jgi:hypothetical protein